MGIYSSISSEYVREKIRGRRYFESKNYISELIHMEQHVRGVNLGKWHQQRVNHWRSRYPRDLEAIWLELNPAEYQRLQNEERAKQRKEREESERLKEEQRIRDLEDQRDWVSAGGVL
jgi:hypothetical protein